MDLTFIAGNLWLLGCAALVMIMHPGFGLLEAGATQSKNTINILFKNTAVLCIGLVSYFLWGFQLMYPGAGAGLNPEDLVSPVYNENYTYYTDLLFQAMFAATAATIVSGAIAERMKLWVFLAFSLLFVGICYPIIGQWQWGGGWLTQLGFHDFAGSTIVHAVGGWGALAGALLLGKRYQADKRPHNVTLSFLGVFLLWFGWWGFNGGSVLSADPQAISLVLLNTSLAAPAGGLAALVTSWVWLKRPELPMMLNGILGGLVGITAGADQMSPYDSLIIGAIAGGIVVASILFIEKYIDDPVSAISVHLTCGIWGTLAVGIFGSKAGLAQLGYQIVGVSASSVAFLFALLVFGFFKYVCGGIRVPLEAEVSGLDASKHKDRAYRKIHHY